MDNQSINEAIEILINNFTRHPGLSQTNDSKLNVFDVLQEFWVMKSLGCLNTLNKKQQTTEELAISAQATNTTIVYEFLERPEPPYVCFVTLPGGACFATFQVRIRIMFEINLKLI